MPAVPPHVNSGAKQDLAGAERVLGRRNLEASEAGMSQTLSAWCDSYSCFGKVMFYFESIVLDLTVDSF